MDRFFATPIASEKKTAIPIACSPPTGMRIVAWSHTGHRFHPFLRTCHRLIQRFTRTQLKRTYFPCLLQRPRLRSTDSPPEKPGPLGHSTLSHRNGQINTTHQGIDRTFRGHPGFLRISPGGRSVPFESGTPWSKSPEWYRLPAESTPSSVKSVGVSLPTISLPTFRTHRSCHFVVNFATFHGKNSPELMKSGNPEIPVFQ